MSLYKQLWIGIAILMLFAFTGSFLVSSVTVKRGVEEHLRIKNIDNANSLALAATQLSEDQTLVRLLISAQFDNGHYQYIRWVSPEGELIVDLKKSDIGGDAPEWFKQWVNIEAPAGTAEIQSGWKQLGSIQLQSAPAFAYQALWHNTLRLLFYFAAAIPVCGLIGHFLMLLITRPLHQVVLQARELRKRRYTKVALPRTREFRELVQSMNSLSDAVKRFFESEASQLHRLQLENEIDPVSGTSSRENFLKGLNGALMDVSQSSEGNLSLFRIHDLQGLNRSQGRQVVDMMLAQLGDVMKSRCLEQEGWTVGRLNGSDFAVLSPGADEVSSVVHELHHALLAKLEELGLAEVVCLKGAAYHFHSGEGLSQILSRVDHALAVAESREASNVEIADSELAAPVSQPLVYWQNLFDEILTKRKVTLNYRPMVSKELQRLYDELVVEYQSREGMVSHRQLHGWASRLGLGAELDGLILKSMMAEPGRSEPVAVELGAQSLHPGAPFQALLNLLSEVDPRTLCLHIPEYLAVQDLKHFKLVCDELHARSFQVGLINAGQHVESIGQLYDCGISHIVLDSSVMMEIDSSESNQVLVRSLATIFHSIGSQVYADGVKTQQEWDALLKLGLDGGSGEYVDQRIQS